MSLEFTVDKGHLIISDGCKMYTEKSNIVGARHGDDTSFSYIPQMDGAAKTTSTQSAKKFLLYANLVFIRSYAELDEMQLRCPTCDKTYTVKGEEFRRFI